MAKKDWTRNRYCFYEVVSNIFVPKNAIQVASTVIAVMLLLWHATSFAQWVVYIIIRNVDDIETKVKICCLKFRVYLCLKKLISYMCWPSWGLHLY